jgi:hypothetical protein
MLLLILRDKQNGCSDVVAYFENFYASPDILGPRISVVPWTLALVLVYFIIRCHEPII